jgi:hypothetical protein
MVIYRFLYVPENFSNICRIVSTYQLSLSFCVLEFIIWMISSKSV